MLKIIIFSCIKYSHYSPSYPPNRRKHVAIFDKIVFRGVDNSVNRVNKVLVVLVYINFKLSQKRVDFVTIFNQLKR